MIYDCAAAAWFRSLHARCFATRDHTQLICFLVVLFAVADDWSDRSDVRPCIGAYLLDAAWGHVRRKHLITCSDSAVA